MSRTFQGGDARLALEICRHTYERGVGNALNSADPDSPLAFIQTNSAPLSAH